ncbi:MAG: type II toxin-antitoxin system HicA family toxin [Desulfobacterales bacterium]|nr:type II toxin-antitoxin system HicA family toxin [Desulfobacterales bacterium]
MPRIAPVHWKVLECIFLKAGFIFKGQTGSHRRYLKAGCIRPVVIPAHDVIRQDIIMSNLRTAGMSRDDYFKFLAFC